MKDSTPNLGTISSALLANKIVLMASSVCFLDSQLLSFFNFIILVRHEVKLLVPVPRTEMEFDSNEVSLLGTRVIYWKVYFVDLIG